MDSKKPSPNSQPNLSNQVVTEDNTSKYFRVCNDLHDKVNELYEALSDGDYGQINSLIREQRENLDYIKTLARKAKQ